MQFKNVVVFVAAGILTTGIQAQTIDVKHLEKLEIRSIGPAGMSGRVTSIDVDVDQPHNIYVGTASGGVWKSPDGGITWHPIFDVAETQAIGAVKINQRNPLEIWVGTGEGNPRNSHNSGEGVFKTMDGGTTWKCMGLEETRLIHRILIDPHDPDIVYVGALGSAWGPGEARGVFKTTDGGQTWRKILYVNDRTGVADMVMDPANHRKLIVALWEFGRTPWDFTSGGEGSGLHITFDGGQTWREIGSEEGLPKGELGRIGLAIAHNKPHIVYALVEAKKNGLYKSTSGGLNWSLVSSRNVGNRPFYYAEIYVDPSNENRIWNLWSYVSKSEDGGKTFETILDYGKNVHPDHHAFWQSPDNPLYVIDGNDGGLNISRDGGRNWRFITNLPVGQFYHINVDMDFPYNIYGGMQDNGSWIGPAYVLKNGGIRNADWREVLFGDGFDIMPRRDNNRYGWGMSQGGHLSYYDKLTGFNQFVQPVHPEGIKLRFNWNAALAQDPVNDCGIYFGSQFVHKSLDCGKNWAIISPDLTTNDTSKQKQHLSGGLTIDDTEAENHTTILAIAPSPVDPEVIWVGTDDGNLQLTTDGGDNWTLLNKKLPGDPGGAWIPQIEVSQTNAGEAFVVVNNYRRNDWSAYLYHTTDYGQTFRRIVDDSDVGSFVCAVVQDAEQPGLLFLGADDGLYFSLNGGKDWQKWPQKTLPAVQIRDLRIHPRDGDLVIGTFGRAIWVLDDINPLREIAATQGAVFDKEFTLFDAPDAYQTAYRSVDGIRFIADAEFRGDNRRRGARLRVWRKPDKDDESDADEVTDDVDEESDSEEEETDNDKEDDDKKDDKARFFVIDTRGDTIRTFSRKLKDGINDVSWGLNRDGVRSPSRRDRDEDADPPGGRDALPGEYRIVCAYRGAMDSTDIQLFPDPRLEVTMDMLVAKDSVLADYQDLVAKASKGFEQLKSAKKAVGLVNRAIVNAPDSTKKMVRTEGKEILKQIDTLMAIFMLPEDAKGIRDDSDKLNSYINRANSYLRSAPGPPGSNGQYAVSKATAEVRQAVERINAFIDTAWTAYKEMVRNTKFDLIKDLEKVE